MPRASRPTAWPADGRIWCSAAPSTPARTAMPHNARSVTCCAARSTTSGCLAAAARPRSIRWSCTAGSPSCRTIARPWWSARPRARPMRSGTPSSRSIQVRTGAAAQIPGSPSRHGHVRLVRSDRLSSASRLCSAEPMDPRLEAVRRVVGMDEHALRLHSCWSVRRPDLGLPAIAAPADAERYAHGERATLREAVRPVDRSPPLRHARNGGPGETRRLGQQAQTQAETDTLRKQTVESDRRRDRCASGAPAGRGPPGPCELAASAIT